MTFRSVWKGNLNFGLVSMPIELKTLQKEQIPRFNQLCDKCHSRINYKRFCSSCKKEVKYEDIIKGFQIAKDKFIIIPKDKIEAVKNSSSKVIEISKITDLSDIDSIYFKKSYWILPQKNIGEKPYVLFKELLNLQGKTAIGKMTYRSKEHLICIRAYRGFLVLTMLYYDSEIIKIDENVKADIKKEELNLGKELLKKMTSKIKYTDYKNEYAEKIISLIRANGKTTIKKNTIKPENDLMKMLKKSVGG